MCSSDLPSGPSQTCMGEDDGEPPSPRSLPRAASYQAWSDGGGVVDAADADSDDSTLQDPDPAGDSAVSAEIGASLGWFAGAAIGLMTLIIPIGTVLLDRDPALVLAGSEAPLTSDETLRSGHLATPPLGSAPLPTPAAQIGRAHV